MYFSHDVQYLTHFPVARANGLTPFSVYQGKWNAAFRDIEAEIIPMCQDQGLAIVSWASLGGGALLRSKEQRKQAEEDPKARKNRYGLADDKISRITELLEEMAAKHGSTLQSVVRIYSRRPFYSSHVKSLLIDFDPQALAYLYSQSPYVVPIVGVQTVEHVRQMLDHLQVRLSSEDIKAIHEANPLDPLFPTNFLFNFRGDQPYHVGLGATDNQQYQMAAVIDAPAKQKQYL